MISGIQPYFLSFDECKLTHLIACISLIFLFGCGGGGEDSALQQSSGNAPDTTTPTVLYVSPTGAGVVINSTITATISGAIDVATINTNTFTLTSGAGAVSGIVSYVGDTATFIPSSNLSYSTTYTATIAAGVQDLAGKEMASSYSWSFTTGILSDATAPTDPSVLTATAISSTQINLNWTASTDSGGSGLAGYKIERCSGIGCANFTQITTTTFTTYSDAGLTASTSYSYRIRAYDNAGNNSNYSSTTSTTTLAPPDTTATLTWNAPTTRSDGAVLTDLAGYKVYYGTAPGNYGTLIEKPLGNEGLSCQDLTDRTQCTYTVGIVEVLASGTYYFVVTAYDTSGNESDFSSEVSKAIVH